MANSFQKYVLMHQDTPVADLELDPVTGAITALGAVHDARHVPVGVPVHKGAIDRGALNEWWSGRAIPASRMGIREALHELDLPDARLLLDKCMGLSLSDQYWIRPAGSALAWSKVNFFENPFSEDVGNILFGRGSSGHVSLMSPDNTSDGWLKKRWSIIDGRRCLVKGGSGATQQEPYNEVIASKMMDLLGIPHAAYRLTFQEGYPYSVCEDFIGPDTELIPAWYVMRTRGRPNHVSVHQHYLDCCDALGVPGAAESVDRMIVLDYLIANEDRHQTNFGVIRNARTLEYIGPAPIYDSGSSLWFDRPTPMVGTAALGCKPFKKTHEQQLGLVRSFDWLDVTKLDGIEDDLLALTRGSPFIDDARGRALSAALRARINRLEDFVNAGKVHGVEGTDGDVAEDSKYSG